jgi:hypothetical protein
MEYIHYFFLTNSQTHVSFGLTFGILVLNTNIKAFLVKVRCSLIIVKVLELFGNTGILFKTSINVLTPVVVFSINKTATKLEQTLLSLLELLLLDSTKFKVVLLGDVRLNLARRCIRRDIIKINISLEVAFLHQFN